MIKTLKRLFIENLAVIERAEIEFDSRLNIFTGETGAGKSILIGGINAILGKRIYRDIVRSGTDKASVYAVFDDIPKRAEDLLLENGFSIEKEDMVCEDGKYYVLMDVKRAEAETEAGEGTGAEAGLKTESPARDAEFVRLLYGDSLIRERNPVLAQYLKEEEQTLMEREASLRQSAKGSLRAAERLKETETRLKWNREVQDEMQRDH